MGNGREAQFARSEIAYREHSGDNTGLLNCPAT